ncbi:hypothetical protein ACFW6C_23470 [Streptomyces fungicidicus]
MEAATALVDARYDALGMIGAGGRRLSAFCTVGRSRSPSPRPA